MDLQEEENGAGCFYSLRHHLQSLLPPAFHVAEVRPCALFCDVLLLEKSLDCVPHGDKGVTVSPHEVC